MGANLELIRATYEGSSEENGRNLLATLAPDATWTEAEGFPYAGTYIGPEAIVAGVFRRLATEWVGYRADVHTFLEDGDRVAAFGVYSGTYKATGTAMRSPFAHLYWCRTEASQPWSSMSTRSWSSGPSLLAFDQGASPIGTVTS